MKRAIAILAALVLSTSGAIAAQKTKAQLSAEITSQLPTNGQGQITAAILRSVLQDMVDSDQQILLLNQQTGTTYTFLAADQGKLVTFNNSSSVAVTLPGATGDFGAGWNAIAQNIGSGTVTISVSVGTINGGTSLTLQSGQIALIVSGGLNTYRAIQYGVMVSVTCGAGLSGGTITTTGTCSITDTLSSANSAGSSSVVPVITYNTRGQLTAVTTATISAGSISAMPDPSGTGIAVKNTTSTSVTRSITGTASNITVSNGDGVSGNPTIDLANVLTAGGPNGSATFAPIVTWDAKGRVTAVSSAMIAPLMLSSTITTTRGAFYFLGASSLLSSILCPAGQIIASGGAGSDPTCISASGSGTVTSIVQGAGLTFSTTPLTASGTISADVATNSNIWSATTNKLVDSAGLNTAGAPVTVTSATSSYTLNLSSGVDFQITLGVTSFLANPTVTSSQLGRTGCIYITQPTTTFYTLSYGSNWKFSGGTAPTLTTTPNAVDILCYKARTTTFIWGVLSGSQVQ